MTTHRIGVIADTHGLLRPAAIAAFQGVERILHAGDIDTPDLLQALRTLAPVTAVRGNVDMGPWARALPLTAALTIEQVGISVLHNLDDLALVPAPAGIRVEVRLVPLDG